MPQTFTAVDDHLPMEKARPGSEAEIRQVLSNLDPGRVRWGFPLARLTSLRVGGPATAAVFPESAAETAELVRALRQAEIRHRVIGRGTNLLAADEGFEGVIIVLGSGLGRIKRLGARGDQVLVRAEAGCSLPKLVVWCAGQELTGLEFAVGIPASVGGAVIMNAGAWSREMAEVVVALTVLPPDGEPVTRGANRQQFGYRAWHGREEGAVVLEAVFALQPGRRQDIENSCRELSARRKKQQPLGLPSAGSFFKNPPDEAAGRLIEAAGLKGCRRGGALVSPDHANFLVNTGGATARDFLELMRVVRQEVERCSGVRLEPEVQFLGRWEIDDLF